MNKASQFFLLSTLQPIGNTVPVASIIGYEIVEGRYFLKVRTDEGPTLKRLPNNPEILKQIEAFGIPEA